MPMTNELLGWDTLYNLEKSNFSGFQYVPIDLGAGTTTAVVGDEVGYTIKVVFYALTAGAAATTFRFVDNTGGGGNLTAVITVGTTHTTQTSGELTGLLGLIKSGPSGDISITVGAAAGLRGFLVYTRVRN